MKQTDVKVTKLANGQKIKFGGTKYIVGGLELRFGGKKRFERVSMVLRPTGNKKKDRFPTPAINITVPAKTRVTVFGKGWAQK